MNINLETLQPWLIGSLAVLLAAFMLLCIFALFSSRGSANQGVTTRIAPGTQGTKRLVVLIHGWTLDARSMEAVEEPVVEGQSRAQNAAATDLTKPDILYAGYSARVFSNASPYVIAAQLNDALEALQEEHAYESIVLCGFSSGALLVRKAYVYGCGSIEDAPGADPQRRTTGVRKSWVDRVDRIVLLAGTNRGAAMEKRPRHMGSLAWFLIRLALRVAKMTRTGNLPRELIRGAPFVANLRLQWLKVMRKKEGQILPIVIQILGDRDDFVSTEDNRDVTVAKDFIWVPVNNTGHLNMLKLDKSPSGEERRFKIALAFGNDDDIARLRRLSPIFATEEDKNVTTVVFVLHGIRDMGEWTSQFTIPLQKAHARQNPDSSAKLCVHSASYGFFGMGPFLLGADRQRNVRWFMDEVTELAAKYPNMRELHFIGHSNGTYVLGSALERYVTLQVDRAVLAGSVLHRHFPWKDYTGRIKQIHNYVGSADIVVGFFPCLFEKPLMRRLNPDIGSGGFNGFTDGFAGLKQTYYVRGGHGAALVEANIPSIVDFIIDGTRSDVAALKAERSVPLQMVSNACWLVWIAILVILAAGAYGMLQLAPVVAHHFGWEAMSMVKGIFLGFYLLVIWYLLNTV